MVRPSSAQLTPVAARLDVVPETALLANPRRAMSTNRTIGVRAGFDRNNFVRTSLILPKRARPE